MAPETSMVPHKPSTSKGRRDLCGHRPADGKDYAVDTFRKFIRAGYQVDEQGLDAATITAGFRWDEVDQLRIYADWLREGRPLRNRHEAVSR